MPLVKNLVTILEEKSTKPSNTGLFPYDDVDYAVRYKAFADHLSREIHPGVTAAAMIIDGGYLTDHGPNHIKTVIQRASELLGSKAEQYISPYEIYLLLTAIHMHDVGHIEVGRIGHEKASRKILATYMANSSIEQRFIYQIAQAHGGKTPGGDKDKISILQPSSFLAHRVNTRFLAAILRFADELADDKTRATRFVDIPHSSQVFHKYADALYSVEVDVEGHEVRLSFDLTKDDIVTEYGKGDSDVFLIDEIFERTFKMYHECVYCMRFFPPDLQIKAISVEVHMLEADEELHKAIKYRFTESGYPKLGANKAADFCDKDLKFEDGAEITGQELKDRVEKSLREKTETA